MSYTECCPEVLIILLTLLFRSTALLAELYSDFMIWTNPSSMPKTAQSMPKPIMPYSIKSFFEVYEIGKEFFFMLEVLFHHYAAVKDLFDCATARPEPCLSFCLVFFCFIFQSVQNDL